MVCSCCFFISPGAQACMYQFAYALDKPMIRRIPSRLPLLDPPASRPAGAGKEVNGHGLITNDYIAWVGLVSFQYFGRTCPALLIILMPSRLQPAGQRTERTHPSPVPFLFVLPFAHSPRGTSSRFKPIPYIQHMTELVITSIEPPWMEPSERIRWTSFP